MEHTLTHARRLRRYRLGVRTSRSRAIGHWLRRDRTPSHRTHAGSDCGVAGVAHRALCGAADRDRARDIAWPARAHPPRGPVGVLYPINPRSLQCFREALTPSGAKDDAPDAPDARLLLTLLVKHRD